MVRPPLGRRQAGAALVAFALATFGGACAGPTERQPPSTAATEGGLSRTGTARVRLETEVHVGSGGNSITQVASGVGDADFAHGSGDVRQSVKDTSLPEAIRSKDVWQEWLVVNGKGYRRSSSSGWENPTDTTSAVGVDLSSLLSRVTIARLVALVAADEHSSQGTEVVGGVKTHKFGTDQFRSVGHVSYLAWFDDAGQLRRVRVSVRSAAGKFSMTETFEAFRVPVAIPVAPATAPSVRYLPSNWPL